MQLQCSPDTTSTELATTRIVILLPAIVRKLAVLDLKVVVVDQEEVS